MTHPPSLCFAPSSSMGVTSVWASSLLVLRLLLLVTGDQGEWGSGSGGQRDGMRFLHFRTFS